MTNGMDLMEYLGKEAAYRQSFLKPPKRRTSHSRTYKLRSSKQQKDEKKAKGTAAGNVQPPHRYGRKVRR